VIVSELVVVVAVCGLSLVLTGFQARTRRFAASPHDLERMLAAVQRACADFLWHETRLLALLVSIVLVVVACPVAALGAASDGHGALAWSIAASSLGAAAGGAIAHFAHWSAARTAQAALGALRRDRNAASGVTLRGASVLAVSIDAVSTGLTALAFVAHYVYLTSVRGVASGEAVMLASRTLAALSFGALCAAVVFHVGGTSLHTAAGVAATGARGRNPRIARDEEQNPVLVAELVGDHVGGVVSRSTDVFAALLLANSGICMLAALVGRGNTGAGAAGLSQFGGTALGVVALPLLIRTIGQFAASVALASSRFEGYLGLAGMLVAARSSQTVLQLAGVFGATLWLLGGSFDSVWALAGALGVLAGALSAGVAVLGVRTRRNGPLGATRSGPTLARAFGIGLQRTWLSCTLVGACLGAAWMIGARTSLAHGGAFALTLAVAGLLGAGAFDACESLFASLSENVHKVATLRRSRFDDAAKHRASEMQRAGIAIGHLGRTQTILGGAAAALLGAMMLPLLTAARGAASSSLGWAHPMVIVGGVLGAGSISFHVGGMLKASSRTATSLDKDLSDRISRRNIGREANGPLPSYKDSVQLATKNSTQSVLPLALGAVLAPFVVAMCLRLIYGTDGGPVIAYGLMAFSSLAALTGCAAALVAQGTSLELGRARRAGSETASNTHSVIEFLERCIGPAALLGLKATVVSSLAAVPLLI
jgi:Na+/H+-translocating membrane pyrophosphatase